MTDAEVFQEILHRYVAIDRRDAIEPAFRVLDEIVDEILRIDGRIVDRSKSLVLGYRPLSALDAIHAAIMQEHGIARIISFDNGFDGLPGVTRISD